MTRRKIGVISVSRSDYGIYHPIIKKIQEDPQLELVLIVGGMHLLKDYGHTIDEIINDGFPIASKVKMPLFSDKPSGIATSIGVGIIEFTKALKKNKLDLLLVLGDRFEMLAAVIAALPMNIPIAHISGGEYTIGAIDDSIRHSITKMSHVHFVSTKQYKKRVQQLGEAEWRIHVTGSPSVDNCKSKNLLTKEVLSHNLNITLDKTILVTFHPITREIGKNKKYIINLIEALETFGNEIIFTGTNSDTEHHVIKEYIQRFTETRTNAHLFDNLGRIKYLSLMKYVRLMIGNSSSGIVEAPSFKLPVVNIGTRQEGRIKPKNVIDVGYEKTDIIKGINLALSNNFRKSLENLKNPFGNGDASSKIIKKIKQLELNNNLIEKEFVDIF